MANYSREDWKTYKNVFDNFTENLLNKFQGQGHFDELLRPILIGKEANVFLAKKGESYVVIKIYRLMNANFNKMHEYLVQDERYHMVKNNKRRIIFSWVQREYSNLLLAREVIDCPTPHNFRDHILIMDLVGDDGEPSIMLKDKPPKNPQQFYDACRDQLDKLKAAGLVHGDISGFNILNHHDKPVFIDFSQSTTTKNPRSFELFDRDVQNLNAFFVRFNVKTR